jgi:hypothetical protein
MRRFALLAAAASFLASTGAALAASPSFTTIDNPGDPTFNQLLGITNGGTITGYFGSGAAGHPNQGYLIAPPYTNFVPTNVQGSVQTQVTGINGSTIVGFWSGTNIGVVNGMPQDANYGFIRTKLSTGHLEYIMVDGCINGAPATSQVLGVNASLNAVGFCVDSKGVSHALVYSVPTGAYTQIRISGAAQAVATGINSSNLISGFYVDGNAVTHAFLAPLSGGVPITFTVPGAQVTQFLGVNDNGEAVGTYVVNGVNHGLVYNPANGQWKTLDDPNAPAVQGGGTTINGLNDKGQAVGFYVDGAGNFDGMLINNAF